MARAVNRLKTTTFENLEPGRHADGDGLYLIVDASGARRWLFMYRFDGRRREMGLGSAKGKRADQRNGLGLADAREKARKARVLLEAGRDPLAATAEEAATPTFGELADKWINDASTHWRNNKHRAQAKMTLEVYAKPLRSKPIDKIETGDVMQVLRPIWSKVPETASRTRARIEKVLDSGKALGFRDGQNPAAWRGHLALLLPPRPKHDRVHHAALPYQQLPAFMINLRAREAVAALALEFCILTAARSGEVLGARWGEIGAAGDVWTVPGPRMKAGREHRTPLTPQAKAALRTMAVMAGYEGDDAVLAAAKGNPNAFIFPGHKAGRPLSGMALEMLLWRMEKTAEEGEWVKVTPHGFRSTFRDWVGEETLFQREVAEAALAHVVGDQTERAYRRGDALEKRRALMIAWADFCDGRETAENVIQMHARGEGA